MVWSWCMHIRLHVLECHTIVSANSSYYEGLDLEDKKHYDVKIATLSNLGDPYAARKESSTSLEWQNPWTTLKQSGIVACAHCTCMAGLGEVCSHIAAVLFLMEANTKLRHHAPHFHASGFHQACGVYPYAPIAEIDFTTTTLKKMKDVWRAP